MSQQNSFTIALAGTPNVGKSTIFNALTKMHQHTGNWSGKTVACCSGQFRYQNISCTVVDLPGTYSLRTHSEEEEIAREYIVSGEADLLLVVCDATCPERGLRLLKQIQELKDSRLSHVILCVNLCDEAAKKGIELNFELLSEKLNIPVIPCTARSRHGLDKLKQEIYAVYQENICQKADTPGKPESGGTDYSNTCSFCDLCCSASCASCKSDSCAPKKQLIPDFSPAYLAAQAVIYKNPAYLKRQERIDRLVTGRFTGSLIMLALLLGIFWLTITGANFPSSLLWDQLFRLETWLAASLAAAGAPEWLISSLIYGVFRVVAWVVSVMLPPMAIFFPLFTLLEDLGYLPRAAFNMDCAFKKCKACGKQCLTMCLVTAAGSGKKQLFPLNKLPSIFQTALF